MHYNFINIVVHDNFIMAQPNLVLTGEIYGKQTSNKFVMYNVLKVSKNTVTLQNIDNPLSLFETTAQKLALLAMCASAKRLILTLKSRVKEESRQKTVTLPLHF